MYVVPPPTVRISLHGRFGTVRVYSSMEQVLRELGYTWIRHNVGTAFRVFSHIEQRGGINVPVFAVHDFVMLDGDGNNLTAGDFNHLLVRKSLYWAVSRFWSGEGPVPGIRKSRGGHGYFRIISTANARRQAQHFADDDEPAPRPARAPSNIPTAWDDFRRKQPSRSWKKYRKNQWKD